MSRVVNDVGVGAGAGGVRGGALTIASARPRALKNLCHLDVEGCGRFSSARGRPALLRARGAGGGAAEMRLVHSFEDVEEAEAAVADDEVCAVGWPSSRAEGVMQGLVGRLDQLDVC